MAVNDKTLLNRQRILADLRTHCGHHDAFVESRENADLRVRMQALVDQDIAVMWYAKCAEQEAFNNPGEPLPLLHSIIMHGELYDHSGLLAWVEALYHQRAAAYFGGVEADSSFYLDAKALIPQRNTTKDQAVSPKYIVSSREVNAQFRYKEVKSNHEIINTYFDWLYQFVGELPFYHNLLLRDRHAAIVLLLAETQKALLKLPKLTEKTALPLLQSLKARLSAMRCIAQTCRALDLTIYAFQEKITLGTDEERSKWRAKRISMEKESGRLEKYKQKLANIFPKDDAPDISVQEASKERRSLEKAQVAPLFPLDAAQQRAKVWIKKIKKVKRASKIKMRYVALFVYLRGRHGDTHSKYVALKAYVALCQKSGTTTKDIRRARRETVAALRVHTNGFFRLAQKVDKALSGLCLIAALREAGLFNMQVRDTDSLKMFNRIDSRKPATSPGRS